ncbi:MAG: DinB family protein [Phycisphaerae bacterium]|nr:DinB family protein [Phycisphaerae bacterium]
MTVASLFLQEFEQESRTTHRFLERTPEDKLNWRPHEKSMTVGQLALHIAAAPGAIIEMAIQNDVAAPDFSRPAPQPASKAEIMAAFAMSVSAVKTSLPTISDAAMQETWRALRGDKVLFEMPRAAFVRSILLNHIYHHRGQFGVYLRLLGAQVPSSYGPSADETPGG